MTETHALGVTELARRLGVTSRTVHNWIHAGSFPGAYHLNPDLPHSPWMIPAADVAAFLERGGKEAAPCN